MRFDLTSEQALFYVYYTIFRETIFLVQDLYDGFVTEWPDFFVKFVEENNVKDREKISEFEWELYYLALFIFISLSIWYIGGLCFFVTDHHSKVFYIQVIKMYLADTFQARDYIECAVTMCMFGFQPEIKLLFIPPHSTRGWFNIDNF